MQLERILQSQGLGTRRYCRDLICSGLVEIAGKVEDNPAAKFNPDGLVFIADGETFCYHEKVYLALNKPANFECSQKPKFHPSIFTLFPSHLRAREIQAVGRLDEDTTGLLILTDDGPFIHALTSPKKKVDKVYEVTVKHPLDDAVLAQLCAGVTLNDDPDVVCAVACKALSATVFHMTLREGKYHQVKRMVAAVGNRVEALRRVQIGTYRLPENLAVGEWVWLDANDLKCLLTPSTVESA